MLFRHTCDVVDLDLAGRSARRRIQTFELKPGFHKPLFARDVIWIALGDFIEELPNDRGIIAGRE